MLLVGLALVSAGFLIFVFMPNTEGKYDAFVMCLNQKNIKMYGASWCPHCQEQKKMFGASQKYLDYVECSTSDGKGQTEICKNNQITSYPTWELANGTRLVGSLSFEKLAEISDCKLNL
ncbi:MAG: thioredoxin domain-containing protein [Candidatus Nitrosotenuis sp.]